MNPNKYKKLYGEKDGRFHIAECNYIIPLWAEKYWLRNVRSKKFRIQKKIIKREVMAAIRLGMEINEIKL